MRGRCSAVVHDGAVGVEAGDRAEARAHKTRAARTRGRDLLVDGEFRDRRTAGIVQGRFQPGEEFAQGGAVLLHGGAHVGGFRFGLARLGKGGRVDRLDHAHRGRHGSAHAGGDAARVDQQGAVFRQRGQGGGGFVIRGQAHAVFQQARAQRIGYLAFGHEQGRALAFDQRVRHEHRVEADVRAAQVEQVADVVQGREEVALGAQLVHLGAGGGQLVGARHRGMRGRVLVQRVSRQARTVAPDLVQQIDVGAQGDAARLEGVAEQARHGQAEHARVHRHRLARLHVGSEPVDMQQAGARRDLHQPDLAAGQFGLGLRVVAAVGPDAGEVRRGDEGADRAGEAGQPFAPLPAARQVFGQVGIARRHDAGVDTVARHGGAQLGQACVALDMEVRGGHGLLGCYSSHV